MGLGHIYRCMALAEMLNEYFQSYFWMRDPGEKIVDIVSSQYHCNIIPAEVPIEQEINMLRSSFKSSDILVLDGYHFNEDYQSQLKPHVCGMVCIDDLVKGHYLADIIINHGSAEVVHRYNAAPYTKVLAGSEYALLRKSFLETAKKKQKEVAAVDTLFICMGGADPFNATNKVLKAALQTSFIKKIYVVIGQAYSFQHELESICDSSEKISIVVESGISAKQMLERIEASQLAVCPSSSVVLEVASVKCGLLTGMVIDNQLEIHDMIVKNGCAETVGDFNSIGLNDLTTTIERMNDVVRINEMMYQQSVLIDGRSGERLLNVFKLLGTC
jgi:UDP-2,4-diacetamido-2,4,6-trideoxy-beta-L-altropyranose hydrolase